MIEIKEKGLSEARAFAAGLGHRVKQITWFAQINTAERIRDRLSARTITDFDRPSPLIVGGLRLKVDKQAGKVAVGWKDVYGFGGPGTEHEGKIFNDAVSSALIPNIQGGRRAVKGLEYRLRQAGLMGQNEWLMPSRTMPGVDRYGNMPGSMASKILADLAAYTRRGDPNSTLSGRRKSKLGIQYVWGDVQGRRGRVRGIFKLDMAVRDRSKMAEGMANSGWKLVAFVTSKAPQYRRRFDFYGIAQREFDRVFQGEWDRVFVRELRKRGGA